MVCKNRLFLIFIIETHCYESKKEFTKKQLKKQLTILTEGKGDVKSELKKAYKALKNLKSLLVGHKSGEDTLSFSDLRNN